MIFNMTGGGSNPLNFQVKTYRSETELKADKPRENTIGVITTTTMTSWVFSATEPKEPEVGMVWIPLGDYSSVEFNAIKRNTLQVYPISVKQYEGGKFVDKVAFSYQNGEWVSWSIYLYNSGDECTDLTGGWSARAWQNNQHFGAGVPTLTKNASDMTIALTVYGGTLSGVVEVGKDIDLTNTKTIRARFSSVNASGDVNSSTYPSVQLVVTGRSATYYFTDHVAGADRGFLSVGTENDVVVEIDVSNISGKHDIAVGLSCYSDGTQTITAVLKSVEMG